MRSVYVTHDTSASGHTCPMAEPITADGRRLIAARGVRGFADGLVAVSLSAFLTIELGYSAARTGLIVTGMLVGSAGLTLATGLAGSRFRRRSLLLAGTVVMILTGLVYAAADTFWILLAVGIVGTINPSSGDVSVFQPLEQSLLPMTTTDAGRSALFARYTFGGALLAAIGSAAAGLPEKLGISATSVFVAYSVAGVIVSFVYSTLSAELEPAASRPQPLGPSKRMVYRLAALFSLDALGGGFVVQSLLALWLFRRHDFTVADAGLTLGAMGVLAAASGFIAVRIEKRLGPIKTMAFTHMPAQILLIGAALMPNGTLAVLCLLGRSLLSSMDVPVRNAYVMTVVTPPERAAAASVTNVPRSLASASTPFVAGWMLDQTSFGWPLIAAGTCKLTYDVLLLILFDDRRVNRST